MIVFNIDICIADDPHEMSKFFFYKFLPIAQENKYLRKFYPEIVCCVYSLELPQQGDSNEYTQQTILAKRSKQIP